MTARTETDRIVPEDEPITLSTGTVVRIQPLKTRQFFRLLKIITRGGAAVLPTLRLSMNMDVEEFIQTVLALVVFSVPEAEQESVDFIRSMCEPNLPDGASDEDRLKARVDLHGELNNPEIDDTFAIIERIVQVEAEDLQALGKRLQRMLAVAEKTGQLKTVDTPLPDQTDQTTATTETPTTTPSSEDSPEPSTSSQPSTDGPTTPSSTSPSPASDKSLQPSGVG